MASETEIANLALRHIGVGKVIANLETEETAEARAIKAIFDVTRDQVLRAFPWPFTTKRLILALVEERPNEEFLFSYRYPTDCVFLRRIQSGIRNDSRQTRVTYRVEQDDDGLTILTDQRDAIMVYTKREEQVVRYPADFVNALALRLGFTVAPELTRGDPFKLQERVARMFSSQIQVARASASDEEQVDELPESEFIRFREGQQNAIRGDDFFDLFNINQ